LDGRTGRGGREKQGSKNEPSRARTRDIASKQQDSLLLTDYNKLPTLIERNGKLSSVLFACNAIPIKVGERFCNLRLVTLFD